MKTPGYCDEKDLWYADLQLFTQMVKFIGPLDGQIIDIGPQNAKTHYLKYALGLTIYQFESGDFNFDKMCSIKGNPLQAHWIFAFEIIEHLQNPLWFMSQLKETVLDYGSIFLSTPGRPKLLWTKHHFREYTPKELTKWILEPLDLVIVRKKRLRINHPWWFYLTGFRPLLRLFFNYTWLYEIKNK